MKQHPALLAAAILLTLAACNTADYTASEAPNQLALADASRHFMLHFAPGSARLARGEVERVDRMVARGEIAGRDRIAVSPAGYPALAARRSETVSAVMLHYGLTVGEQQLADVPRDSAIVEIGRTLVTLPPCPNWSKPASSDFTNTRSSNFGCASATNLGEMVASPADLASGQPLGPAAGQPANAAVKRYLYDENKLPEANTKLPISGPSSGGTPPGAGNSPGGS